MTLIVRHGKRGDRWGFRFWYRGRLYKATVGTEKMAAEAEKRERARLDLAAFEGRWGPLRPRLTTLEDGLNRYLEAKADKSSLSVDRQRLLWWVQFLRSRRVNYLQEISPELVDAGKAELGKQGMAPATVYGYLAALRGWLQLAIRRWGILTRNATQVIDWPRVRAPTIRIPTAEEREALLAKAPPDLRMLVLVALYTGLRKSSILRLEAKDFQFRPGWLRAVQKGDRELWVPVAAPLQAALAPLILRGGRLFAVRQWPEKRWRELRNAAGCPWLRVHDLRHCTGSLLSDAGIGPRIVQEFLGHRTLAMATRYSHPQKEALEKAARRLGRAVLKLKGKRS